MSGQKNRGSAAPLPSLASLQALYDYDPLSGELSLKSGGKLSEVSHGGYLVHREYLGNGCYAPVRRAHRIAWKMHYGEEPPPVIDHIDGDPQNNRISNLRSATVRENCLNRRGHRRKGRQLPKGVYQREGASTYYVTFKIEGKLKYIATFPTVEQAARCAAGLRILAHGAFARTR